MTGRRKSKMKEADIPKKEALVERKEHPLGEETPPRRKKALPERR